jgi:hypothetical protein
MTKNLKLILLDTHNQLVQLHDWIPGESVKATMEPAIAKAPSTQPLIDFVNFLNEHPQALELLKRHNIDWDSVNNGVPQGVSIIDQDDPFAGETLGPACNLENPDCEACQ